MSQVLSNILTNAAKYTQPGGLIEIRALQAGEHVRVHVRDNGIGIAPDMLPAVFDAFAQERRQGDRPQGGLGLGLAIVKNLVEAHGGRVTMHSEGEGRGAECVITLAAAPEGVHAATGEPPLPKPAAPAAVGRAVLIVDDNEDAARMLGDSLSALGHHIEVATDAPSALELAKRFVPSVALLDLGLPVVDGYELATRLRGQDGWASVRFVALTGYGQQHDRDRSAAAGFDAHLVKPVDLEVVDRAVRRLAGESTGSGG
jgi:CheY-like chemotaxis protein/anti-sigma regulatory factor (Ser/Thr protein kinase)